MHHKPDAQPVLAGFSSPSQYLGLLLSPWARRQKIAKRRGQEEEEGHYSSSLPPSTSAKLSTHSTCPRDGESVSVRFLAQGAAREAAS